MLKPDQKQPAGSPNHDLSRRRDRIRESHGQVAVPYFRPAALTFLRALERNNRRDWFDPRKCQYEQELKKPFLALIEVVTHAMIDFAPGHVRPAQKCMMRIYRDTRFSSDKRPYKNRISAWWSQAGLEKTSGAGFYMHVSAKEVLIAAGVYMPEREQLLAIRRFLLEHHSAVRPLLEEKKLRRVMDSFSGEPLTRPPKGFPKEHPAMDLIRCKQWGLSGTLDSQAALRPDFSREVIRRFQLAAPLVETLNVPLLRPLQKKRRPLFGLG